MTVGVDGTVLGHVVRGAARERRRRRAARAAPGAHAQPGDLDPRAHGAAPRRRGGTGRDRFTGFGLLDITAAVQARRRAGRTAAAAGRRRAQRRRLGRADARASRAASPMRSPTSATTGATSTRSTCAPARRCACAPRGCRWAATSGSTSRIFSPGTRDLASRATRRAGEHARTASDSSLRIRNSTPRDGFFFVQVTPGAAGARTACAGASARAARTRG